jgi:nucleotide-binding universal stress UspA family protein
LGTTAWCGVDAAEFVRQAYQNLTEEAQKELNPIESELKGAGLDVRTKVAKGVPQTKILEVAEEEGATSIVLGSHGRGNLSIALLGSVSGYVIQHSKIPVVVIKRDSIDGAD